MRAVVLVSVAAIACNDAPGLTLRVLPNDSNITELRVLISDRACSAGSDPESTSQIPADCSGIALGSGTAEVPGHIRFLNDGSADDGLIAVDPVQKISGDKDFTVRLVPNPTGTSHFTHVALIGFDDADNAYAMAELTFGSDSPVPSAPTYEQITLESLDAAGGAAVSLVHGAGAGDYVCAEIDNAPDTQGTSLTTEFFVPVEDPDCDGIPLDKECKPYLAGFSGAFGGADSDVGTCAVPSKNTQGCTLGAGSSACADGTGPAQPPTGCVELAAPSPCVPQPMCVDPCDKDLDPTACFGSDLAPLQAMAHVECSVSVDTNNNACLGGFVVPAGVTQAIGSGACDIELQAVSNQIALDGFDTQADFVDLATQATGTVMMMPSEGSDDLCGLAVLPPDPDNGGSAANIPLDLIGYARITTAVGSGSVIVPMVLAYTPGQETSDCTANPTTCQVVAGTADDTTDRDRLLGCVGITVGSGSGSGSGSSAQ